MKCYHYDSYIFLVSLYVFSYPEQIIDNNIEIKPKIILFYLYKKTHFCYILDCRYGNELYVKGATFDKGDNCNTCKCLADGTVRCSEKRCHNSKLSLSVSMFLPLSRSLSLNITMLKLT